MFDLNLTNLFAKRLIENGFIEVVNRKLLPNNSAPTNPVTDLKDLTAKTRLLLDGVLG